jgi:hypothetical protein
MKDLNILMAIVSHVGWSLNPFIHIRLSASLKCGRILSHPGSRRGKKTKLEPGGKGPIFGDHGTSFEENGNPADT